MIALGKVWLALGLIGFAATSWAAETHRVVAIAGSRYEPSDMAIDQALSKGTLVHAEKDTLIVLRKSWPVDSGYDHQNTCHEWIVVRDNTFRVDDENPRPCPEKGDPGALALAMREQRMLARYVVLGDGAEKNVGQTHVGAPEFLDALYELEEEGLPGNPESQCFARVQGKIPRNAEGETRWDPADVRSLCRGAHRGYAAEPAKCFARVMELARDVDWGWRLVVSLCRGTADAQRTFTCLLDRLRSESTVGTAVQQCGKDPDPPGP